jgi:hypothetical protein
MPSRWRIGWRGGEKSSAPQSTWGKFPDSRQFPRVINGVDLLRDAMDRGGVPRYACGRRQRWRELAMTEAEWLACADPQLMLQMLSGKEAERGGLACGCCQVRCVQRAGFCPAYRKLRLFACACCLRIMHLLPEPVCQNAVQALEQYIDGAIKFGPYQRAYAKFDNTRRARFDSISRRKWWRGQMLA